MSNSTSTLDGHLFTAQDGTRGFDCNAPVSAAMARAFRARGYGFAVRYVARNERHVNDCTADEAAAILEGGLGLMLVQHVESESSWVPSSDKGATYGENAATFAREIGVPPGTMLWLDLEGVAAGTLARVVIDYANAWHRNVSVAGFLPGLYVGWHAGLGADDLYRALRFTHYWGALNLDEDQFPSVRGLQMKQHECRTADLVRGCPFAFDTNTTMPDRLGGRVVVLAPENWLCG